MVSLSTRPWPETIIGHHKNASCQCNIFFSKCRCIVDVLVDLSNILALLFTKNGRTICTMQLRSFSSFIQLVSLHVPLPRASQTSHGLYPRRPGSVKRQRDIHGFLPSPSDVSVSLDRCVLSMYMKWCLEWYSSSSPSSLQSIYYLYLPDNLWIYPIGISASSLEKNIFFV